MQSQTPADILVYATGGQAKVVYAIIQAQAKYRVVGFIVDHRMPEPGESFLGAPVYHLSEIHARRSSFPDQCAIAIGDNLTRRTISMNMMSLGFEPVTIIHPYSSVSPDAQLGRGVVICAGAVIDPEVIIGDGSIVNVNAGLGHECNFGNYCHLSAASSIGGNCTVEDLTFVAMGATILPGLKIGEGAMIAAGALVTKHVPAHVLAAGSPARFRIRNQLDPEELASHAITLEKRLQFPGLPEAS